MSTQQSSFLLIGTDDREFSVSRLKVAGLPYRRKSLYSGPANWERIIQLLEDPSLTAVLGTQGRTRMTVLPLRRSVGLSTGTASSRVATVPMCVRRRPSRTRSTISTS